MKKVNRSIHFYEVKIHKYNSVSNTMEPSKNFKEDINNIFDKLKILNNNKNDLSNSKYIQKNNGTYDFVIFDGITDKVINARFINVDDSGLTYYVENGELKPIKEKFSENIGIAEVAHFTINLETGILAFEYNNKCSLFSSLANYLTSKNSPDYMIKLVNLIAKDTKERLQRMKYIKNIEFKGSNKLLDIAEVSKGNKIFDALGIINEEIDTDETQLMTIAITNKGRQSKKKLKTFSATNINADALEILENVTDVDSKDFKFYVEGLDEAYEKIRVNYFKDLIISNIIIEDKIDKETFFYKIEKCYERIYKQYIS